MIHLTREAAAIATEPQIRRLAVLHGTSSDTEISAWAATFDLPSDYLGFRVKFASNGGDLYGGIAPDGSAST